MAAIGRRAPRIGVDGLTTGKRVQALRTACGMSLADLAAAAGMSSQAIWKLEDDGSNEPSYLNGLRIATALHVSPWHLAGEPDPAPDITVELDGYKVAFFAPRLGDQADTANSVRAFIVDAIRSALKKYAGTGSVQLHSPKRQVYEGVAEPPEMDVVEMNRDLGLLAVEVKKLRTEVERLAAQVDEPSRRRVQKRAG